MSPYLYDVLRLVGVLVLIAANGYFVAAEFALVTVRWTRIEELVSKNKFGSHAVQHALENLDDAIAAAQLGITFASLALGWIGEPALAHLVQPLFRGLPEAWGIALSHAAAVAVAYLLLTYLHVVLGEQAPKALAIRRAEDVALFVTGPVLAFGRAFRPFIKLIGGSSNWLVGLLRLPEAPPEKEVHSVQELGMLVEETEEAGIIPPDQADYLLNVFRLTGKKARDVAIPREKVVTLSLRASSEEVLEVVRETAHTRMPVWEGNPDNIVGIVNTKNLFHLFSVHGLVILMDAMYPPLFVSPDTPVAQLLRTFRRERRPMAVVRDATGRFLGIVTLEDILEEIVGEIEDEHDVPTPSAAAPAGQTARTTPPGAVPLAVHPAAGRPPVAPVTTRPPGTASIERGAASKPTPGEPRSS